ncbi:MAG TPA: TVP38/TMEM64 family protein [Phycisphaeraceae bacterium]|nr:TVP38/TMEM64 family protein [Phycisphaeraceae bacterium]
MSNQPDKKETDDPRKETTSSETAAVVESLKNMGSAGLFGLLTMIIPPVGLFFLITYAKRTRPWIESLGLAGPVVVAVLMMLLAGFAIMPTQAFSVVIGVLFGPAFGLPLAALVAVSGAVGAAMIAYGWVYLVAEKKVMREIEAHPKARIIHHALVARGFFRTLGIVTLLRIPPNLPFATTSFVMASLRISFPAYTLGTLFGMAPRLIVATWIGYTLGDLDKVKDNPYRFWFLAISLVFSIIIVLLLSRWSKAALSKYEQDPQPAS